MVCFGGGTGCATSTGLVGTGKGRALGKGPLQRQGGWLEYGEASLMAFLIHFSWPGINKPLILWELYHGAQYKHDSL